MTNRVVTAFHWAFDYWTRETAFVTDNHNGTWHVSYWKGITEKQMDVTEAEAEKIVERIAAHYDFSKDIKHTSYSATEITADNAESVCADLMRGYDNCTEFISSCAEQDRAEKKNAWILDECRRIREAVAVPCAA